MAKGGIFHGYLVVYQKGICFVFRQQPIGFAAVSWSSWFDDVCFFEMGAIWSHLRSGIL